MSTTHSTPRALAVLLALLALPWTVVVTAGGVSLVFPWGLFDPGMTRPTTLPAYLFVHTRGLPTYLLAWPTSVLLYAGAVVSAAVGVLTGREDARLTGGLLALAGLTHLSVAWGLSRQPGRVAYPVGALAVLATAWWFYWPALRTALLAPVEE